MGKNVLDYIIGGVLKVGKTVAVGGGARYTDDGVRQMGGVAGLIDKIDLAQEAYAARNFTDGVLEIGKGAFNSATKPVSPDKAKSIMASITGRELKTSVAIGGVAVLGGLSVGDATFKIENKLSRGENIGVVNVPGVTTPIEPISTEEIEKRDGLVSAVKDSSLSNYGATGDIVFALNNMR